MTDKLEILLAQLTRMYPKYIDLSLKRLLHLLEKLDNPQKKLPPIIHIAGTNGKGSTAHIICSILQEAGYKVSSISNTAHVYSLTINFPIQL